MEVIYVIPGNNSPINMLAQVKYCGETFLRSDMLGNNQLNILGKV